MMPDSTGTIGNTQGVKDKSKPKPKKLTAKAKGKSEMINLAGHDEIAKLATAELWTPIALHTVAGGTRDWDEMQNHLDKCESQYSGLSWKEAKCKRDSRSSQRILRERSENQMDKLYKSLEFSNDAEITNSIQEFKF